MPNRYMMKAALGRLCAFADTAGLEVSEEHLEGLCAGARWLAQASGASGLSQYDTPADALLRAMGPALAWFLFDETPRIGRLVDLGAGNGAIGATIAFFAPDLQVDLVDRAKRAYTTSELLVARLGIANARPVLAEHSDLAGPPADAVVFRALAGADEALTLAQSVVAPHGIVGAYHRRGDRCFEHPAHDLTVLGGRETPVRDLVLTCYRR